MKIRMGFVSNSSSSSFTIDKFYLSGEQIYKIKNHIEVAKTKFPKKNFNCDEENAWEIRESESSIIGGTDMDNFDMEKFLKLIGVNIKKVLFDEGNSFFLSNMLEDEEEDINEN